MLLAAPAGLGAQDHQLRVEVAASHARPPAGLDVEPGSYVIAGLRWLRAGPWAVFAGVDGGWSAGGERGDWTAGYGGVSLAKPLTPRLRARVDAWVTGFRVEAPDRYRAVLGRVVPALAWRSGAAEWELRLHGAAGGVEAGAGDEIWEDDPWLVGAGASLSRPVGALELEVSGDGYRTGAGSWAAAGVAAEMAVAGATARLSLQGWRRATGETDGVGELRLEVPFGRAVRMVSSAGRSAPDALLGTAPGLYASVGVGVDVLAAATRPEPAVVELLDGGRRRARFTVRRPDATGVELLGDFSRWEAVPMEPDGDGGWSVVVDVEAGVHHFGFRVDGTWWVPEGVSGGGEDEWGRPTATLVVPNA